MNEINVVVDQKNGVINFNFEDIKNQLSEEMNTYKTMVFTEESKADAKKTVAALRKLKKAVNDKKIEVKKSYMDPYTQFESKVKELDALIDEPIAFINQQVEEFEKKRIEERKELINQIYEEVATGYEEYIPLSRIYDSKWENATTSKKAITEDVKGYVEKVNKDLDTIKAMESDFEDKGIEAYKRTLELADAIQCMNNYQKQREEILAREEAKKQEELKAQEIEQETEIAQTPVTQELNKPSEQFVEPKVDNNVTATYEVKADGFQLVQLEAQMRKLGIEYRKVN